MERDHLQVLSDQWSRLFSENLKGTSGRSACATASSEDHFVGAGGTTLDDADDSGSGSDFDDPLILCVSEVATGGTLSVLIEAP